MVTGSLHLKGDKWYAVLNVKVDGVRKQKWINTGLPKNCLVRERKAKLEELRNLYDTNPQLINSKIKFADYIKVWLKEARIKVDEVTYRHYEADANAHIIPYFEAKGTRLVKLTRQDLQDYFAAMYDHGNLKTGKGLSAKTLRHHKNVIMQTVELALLNKIIVDNPCVGLTLPKLERHISEFYDSDTVLAFLNAAKGLQLYEVYYMTAYYGFRRSEILGLKWSSVNLKKGTLTVERTRTKATTVVEKEKTKTDTSLRSFPLTAETVKLLESVRKRESENRKLFGNSYHDNDYVFKWDDGTPYDPDYLTHRLPQDAKKLGFPHINFHGLRHSCGSLLNEAGMTLKDIQEWLGHADIQTTANIYLHLGVKQKLNISSKLAAIQGGQK